MRLLRGKAAGARSVDHDRTSASARKARCRNASRRRINASERRINASTCGLVAATSLPTRSARGAAPVSHRAPQLTPRKSTVPAALGFDRSYAGCSFGDGRAAVFRGASRVRLFRAKLGLSSICGSRVRLAVHSPQPFRIGATCACSEAGIVHAVASVRFLQESCDSRVRSVWRRKLSGTARTAQNKAAAQDQRKTADRDDTVLVKGAS